MVLFSFHVPEANVLLPFLWFAWNCTLTQLTRRQARYLHDRPDFHGSLACSRNPCGDADRLVEILGVDQEVAAELFARFRERTVGYKRFAVAHAHAGGR